MKYNLKIQSAFPAFARASCIDAVRNTETIFISTVHSLFLCKAVQFYNRSNILYTKLQKCNLFITRPPKDIQGEQEKPPALKREHPALQNRIFLNFFLLIDCRSLLLTWIRIRIQPTKINADPCKSRSRTLLCLPPRRLGILPSHWR